jgi:DNA-binding phage protein
MSKAKAANTLIPFDATRYLKDEEAIAEYMTAVLETDDPDLLLLALGDVARALGVRLSAQPLHTTSEADNTRELTGRYGLGHPSGR